MTRDRFGSLQSPVVMGILNVTPDSFSDGGTYLRLEPALLHAEKLIRDGAQVIDIGGESTRPGAAPVSESEELERVIPVIEAVRRRFSIPISIDTQKFEVARRAVDAGAEIVNDIAGGADARLATLPATFLLMHRQGVPSTMQINPQYPDGVVVTVARFLESRVRAFREAGVPWDRIWIDPGIGFGKSLDHCLEVLREVSEFAWLGSRLALGTSRKSFLGRVLGQSAEAASAEHDFSQREAGGLATVLWGLEHGATVFRVHDVGNTVRTIQTWEAIRGAKSTNRRESAARFCTN